MTPADRRWRALAKWLTNYAAELVMAYDKVADDPKSLRMAFYYEGKKVACRAIIDEMRRLSRRPRAPKPKRRA